MNKYFIKYDGKKAVASRNHVSDCWYIKRLDGGLMHALFGTVHEMKKEFRRNHPEAKFTKIK